MRNQTHGVMSLTAVLCLTGTGTVALGDWPNFRGPNHDGVSQETGLLVQTDKPLKLLWEGNVGSAYSSFACVGDHVYTCGQEASKQILVCLDAGSGKIVWKTPFADGYRNEFGDGPRATPAVSGGKVYILGAMGTVFCADAGSGAEIWKRRLNHQPTWGYSGSVLIDGDLAIVTGGKSDGALLALNKDTGSEVWKRGEDLAGYATPYPFEMNATRYVVGFTGQSVLVVEPKTGREVLRMPWKTDWDINAASPIFHDGYLFLSSGYQTGCGLFKLTASGDKLVAEKVWKSKVLLNKFQSCVLHEGKLYGGDQKALKCVDFLTGTEQWKVRKVKHATVTLASGHLYVLTEDGTLKIAPASPSGFEPSAEATILSGRCWTVPVMHQGRIYARNLERIVCFDLAGS